MPADLIVVTGTGTGVGKTFFSVGLTRAIGRSGKQVLGHKPVESGVIDLTQTDARALEDASTFHVKQSLPVVRLRAATSPHLAARLEHVTIDADALADGIARVRSDADAIVVELAGGLFSPFSESLTCLDFAARLEPSAVVLVTLDRLGVIHDVNAACRAARGSRAMPTHVVLNAPEKTDASTGTNAAELARFVDITILGHVARNDTAAFDAFASALTR